MRQVFLNSLRMPVFMVKLVIVVCKNYPMFD